MQREDSENDLQFLGFFIMDNCLKPTSRAVIEELSECGIKSAIATGDHIQTSICIAQQCSIIPRNTKKIYFGDVS